ncbi:transposase [Oceanobacillus sp. Castelsardo]
MTPRWDLSAEQIMVLYRYRWMIETFFKWIKQHLKLVKI